MQDEPLMPVAQFCNLHNIEYSFISSLHEFGLIEINSVDNTSFISSGQIRMIEKLIRLHYDLDINLEGVDAISHLLQQMRNMQYEINSLKNRLRIYED